MYGKFFAVALTGLAFLIPTPAQAQSFSQSSSSGYTNSSQTNWNFSNGPGGVNFNAATNGQSSAYGKTTTTQAGPLGYNQQTQGYNTQATYGQSTGFSSSPVGGATYTGASYGTNQTTQYKGYQGQFLGQQYAGGQSQTNGSGFQNSYKKTYP